MLLYSTLLNIKPTLTKDAFIKLVIEWNQTSRFEINRIPNLVWNGERNIRFGTDEDPVSLAIEEYRNKNIIAVRYRKSTSEGIIWCTDYVMNYDEMRMAVQLDRTYTEDALDTDTMYSTPVFIAMLMERGYLEPDGDFPLTNRPIDITGKKLSVISDVIMKRADHHFPVVYVSKTEADENPVNVGLLAKKLKGIAHVLVQKSVTMNDRLSSECEGMNDTNGAIGIYYSGDRESRHYLYHRDEGYDFSQMDKVIDAVTHYSNIRNLTALYTYEGVRAALLNDKLTAQREKRAAAELEKEDIYRNYGKEILALKHEMKDVYETFDKEIRDLKEELKEVYDTFDSEIEELKQQINELTRTNESLRGENFGLRNKLQAEHRTPILYLDSEYEFYPGEISDLLIDIIKKELQNSTVAKSRKEDILKDILKANAYNNSHAKRADNIKRLLNGYTKMSAPMANELADMGFEITDDGKHHKLTYYKDNRYWTSLSKTASDHREGENAASDIIRTML